MLQGMYDTSEQKAMEFMREIYGTKPWCACYEVREHTAEENRMIERQRRVKCVVVNVGCVQFHDWD